MHKETWILIKHLLVSIVVSIPACHAGDRGSIPRRGGYIFLLRCTIRLDRERMRGHYLRVIVAQWALLKQLSLHLSIVSNMAAMPTKTIVLIHTIMTVINI